MAKHGKRFREVQNKVDADKQYALNDACDLVGKTKTAKFDESVDIAIHLDVDPRHADQMVRGAVSLPHGTGKKVRVAVFAKGPMADEAIASGADIVGGDEFAQKVQKGFFEFDKVIAAPDMMAVVGKLGRVLGPRGMMPNPKVGTVTKDVAQAVKEIKSGKIEYKVDKSGTLHCPVGRASFPAKNLQGNIKVLLDAVSKAKPASVKGQYFKRATVSLTMGPGIRLDLTQALAGLI